MFVPATLGSELRNSIQNIVTKKTAELGMSLLVRETSERKIKDRLFHLDLTGCIYPRSLACKFGLKGVNHTRSGAQYYITCKVCRAENKLAEYHRETGLNAVHSNKNTSNAMAKHLAIYHKENKGDPDSFE